MGRRMLSASGSRGVGGLRGGSEKGGWGGGEGWGVGGYMVEGWGVKG